METDGLCRAFVRKRSMALSGDGSLTFHSEGQRAVFALHPTAASCDLPGLFEAFEFRPSHTASGAFDRASTPALRTRDIDDAFTLRSSLDVLGSATIRYGEISNLEAFQEIATTAATGHGTAGRPR